MGMEKAATLKETNGDKTAELWHRRGLDGVCVEVDGHRFAVPREALENMVGEHIQSEAISAIEQMDSKEILKKLTNW